MAKEPIKIIKFDKATAQLLVHIETENELVSTIDKKTKTGRTSTTLNQTIFKNGIKELLESLEKQKETHETAKTRAQEMLKGEEVALEMIDKDIHITSCPIIIYQGEKKRCKTLPDYDFSFPSPFPFHLI